MKAAGDIDRGGKLDHGGVIAHFPWPKTLAEIAIQIDGLHVLSPCTSGSSSVLRVPRAGVDRTDRGTREVGIMQGFEVEIKIFDGPDAVG